MTSRTLLSDSGKLRAQFRIALLAVSVAVVLPALNAPAAAAGFFETIFGVRPTQPAYAPRPQQNIPLAGSSLGANGKPIQKAKPKSKIVKARPDGPIVKVAAPRPQVLPGPLGPFLLDPTLRRGDVVVTSDGLKVFTGQGGSQHAAADFSGLAHASRFAAGNSSVLAAIDRANRFSAKPLVEVQAVPVPRPAAPAKAQASLPDKQASIAAERRVR